MVEATVRHGDDTLPITAALMIGRHSTCDLVIKDGRVSRRHLQIGRDGNTVWAEAVGATNSTRVNGKRIESRIALKDGDVVTIGETDLKIAIAETDDAPDSSEDEAGTKVEKAKQDEKAEDAKGRESTRLALEAQRQAEDAKAAEDQTHPHLVYQGHELVIDGTKVLGRHRDCDMQLQDPKASRKHIEISLDEQGRPRVKDLGSANGTSVNGQSLEGTLLLRHGDRITVGVSHMIVQVPGSPEPEAKEQPAEDDSGSQPKQKNLADLIGTILAGHKIEASIGEGALGVVFRAKQLSLNRQVAMKVFRPGLVSKDRNFREQLLESAKTAGRISHENVAKIHESGEADGLPWYSMEFVDGESLSELVERDGPMEPMSALIIAERIARGLESAHQSGICHHDLKPDGIMVNEDGRVKVLDLGLGAVLLEGRQSTLKNAVVGTPAYMSPERARSEQGDKRSDLYSLGCVLFFLLTGKPPFSGRRPMDVLRAHQEDPIPSVSDLRPGLPAALDTLMAGLLAKNVDWRFADVAEFCEELGQARTQVESAPAPAQKAPSSPRPRPTKERTTGERPRSRTSSRQQSNKSAMVGLVITALIIMAVVVLWKPLMNQIAAISNETAIAERPNGDSSTAGTGSGGPTTPVTTATTTSQDPTPASDSWATRWQATTEAVAEQAGEGRWAGAEFQLISFRQAALGAGENELAEAANKRHLALGIDGRTWYRSQISALPEGGRARITRLAALRNQVLDRDRADCEARYQQVLSGLAAALEDGRRRALQAAEQGRLDALPAIGNEGEALVAGTPLEGLGERFRHLCSAAANARWAGSWPLTIETLVEEPSDEPDQALADGALLLLTDDAERARRLLLGHAGLGAGEMNVRRDQLLRADALVLTFDSPSDLTFLDVPFGEVAFADGALTGDGEPVEIACTEPLSGDSWEAETTISVAAGGAASVTVQQAGKSTMAIQVSDDGMTVRLEGADGTIQQENPRPQGDIRIRFVSIGGLATIFVNDETILAEVPLSGAQGGRLVLNLSSSAWSLDSLALFSGSDVR